MAQAQSVDARNSSNLQNNKLVTAKRMKRMGYLSRTQMDRLVQQAILQVLEPILDPTFSSSSFGFRPGRSAHQALAQAQSYVADGREIVVNHDVLMARLARRIGDKRLLRIIRRFLEAGMMQGGVCIERHEGTPQGGPLAP